MVRNLDLICMAVFGFPNLRCKELLQLVHLTHFAHTKIAAMTPNHESCSWYFCTQGDARTAYSFYVMREIG